MLRVQVHGHVVQQGDSRMASTYRSVLDGEAAALMHADPPYCLLVRRNAKGRKREPKTRAKIHHSAVRRFDNVADYRRFTERWLRPALACVSADGHAIVWTNLLGREPIRQIALDEGFVEHGTFLWAKLGKTQKAKPGGSRSPGVPLEPIAEAPVAYNTPALRHLWASAPYYHDGSARDLRALLTSGNKGDRMGKTSHLKPREIDALVAYLQTL